MKYENRKFWSRGYYVSRVGLNRKTIEYHIREQEGSSGTMSK